MQTIHASNGRRLLLTRLLCGGLLARGMSAALAGQTRGWQVREFTRIELVAREAGTPPNQHPTIVSPDTLREQLARVRFAAGKESPLLFTADELSELIDPLAQAFKNAGPDDDVQLLSSARRDGGLLAPPTAVTARLFVQDGQLQLIVHDARFEFFDAYRGAHIAPRFVYGSRAAAGKLTLASIGGTNKRADWLSMSIAAPAAAAATGAAATAPAAPPARTAPEPAKAETKGEDIEQRLEMLKRLRDKNLISEDEYQQKRKELLQRL